MTRLSLSVTRRGGCAGSRAAIATVTVEDPSSNPRLGMACAAEDDKFPCRRACLAEQILGWF